MDNSSIFPFSAPEDGANGTGTSAQFVSCDSCVRKCIFYLEGRAITTDDCHIN